MSKFNFNEAPAKEPVRIEQVWAEKPGGGTVHVTVDVLATTPVKLGEGGVYEPISSSDTTKVPDYVTGNTLYAEDGEYQPVRLLNGANLRKETAVITAAQAAKISGINLV